MELTLANDLNSAKLLDSIMNGYPGRNRGTIFADQDSMTAMLFFLERKMITVTEHTYPYDQAIRENREMMDLYTELARETRWKPFEYTEIEGLRVNALRVLLEEGKPSYDDFICYREGRIRVHCGNLEPHPLLMYLTGHEQVEQFYIFPIPTARRTARQSTIASPFLRRASPEPKRTGNMCGTGCGRYLKKRRIPISSKAGGGTSASIVLKI